MQSFGEHLKTLRKAANLTQTMLADKLNIHPQTVSKWERDLSRPDISQLGELAGVLGVTLEKLCGQEETGETYTGSFDAVQMGKQIGIRRISRGESQEQLAEALQTSTDAISRWERGITCPDIEQLTALAAYFGIPVSRLYCAIGEEHETENVVLAKKRRRILVPLITGFGLVVCAALILLVFMLRPTVRQYTVTVDGLKITVNGDDWFTPSAPQREGYDFVCWTNGEGETMTFPQKIMADVSYTSVFVPHEYTIDYWLNGGFFEDTVQTGFTVENGTIELPVPVKTGQTFEGWYLQSDYSGEAAEHIECTGEDLTLYAKWSDAVYTVRYELNGGILYESNPSSVTAESGYELAEPVREGYTFLGWYDQEQGGKKYASVGGAEARNLVLYALWQKTDALFTIYYDLNGGKAEGENPVSVGAGEVYRLYDAAKTGYDFLGWNTKKDGSGEFVEYLYGVDETLYLYAVFAEKEYLIRYVYEGTYEGQEINPNTISYEQSVDLLPVYRYGYRFEGWFDAKEGGNKIATIDKTNILTLSVLYARFTPLEFSIEANAGQGAFQTEEGEKSVYTWQISYGETLVLPECDQAGYVFLGWADENGDTVTEINVFNIRDMCLTAVWRADDKSYAIEYVLNGGTMAEVNPESVLCGEILPLYEPEREGYIFLGWYDNALGQGKEYFQTPFGREEDLTLYALWQEKRVNGSSEFFSYTIVADSTVTITNYTGESGENVTINVPATIEGLPVTELKWYFGGSEFRAFKSIVLPEGLLTLGQGLFKNLYFTEPIVIPASVEEIGKNCFYDYEGEVRFAEDSRITEIGDSAFEGAKISNVLVLPAGVEVIGYNAFASSSLPGIVLPDGLKIIHENGFYSTKKVRWKVLYIPSSVTYIGSNAISCLNASDGGAIYTGLSKSQCQSFAADWYVSPRTIYYNWEPHTVTFQDGEKENAVTGNAISLPKPEKNGYTFIGWKTEKGVFADWMFIPTEDTVLMAVYEKKTSEGGRNLNTPAIFVLGETKDFYGVNNTSFYVRLDTDVPIDMIVETQHDQKYGQPILYRQNENGEFEQEYSSSFEYMPGEILKITFKNGLNSCVAHVQVKILAR